MPPPRTTKDTYGLRTEGLEWSDLPILFQDAILLTRALGCRYMWADSLCIVQDDEQDWIEQSATMADVYSHGYLNIAAAAAMNPSASLFHERQEFIGKPGPGASAESGPMITHAINPQTIAITAPVHVRRSHAHAHACVFSNANGRHVVGPLLRRAWVFRERLLSRRTVFFTLSEMLWQCRECLRCECGDMDSYSATLPRIKQARADSKGPVSEEEFYGEIQQGFAGIASGQCSVQQARDLWPEVARQYSILALTRESDRPYAVAGLARRIQEVSGDTYLAGLWLEDLPRGLLWIGIPLWSETARRRPGIPSWSWMSRDTLEAGGVPWVWNKHTNDFRPDPRVRVIVEGTFCSKKAGDEFGATVDGQVQLAAAMRCAVVMPDKTRGANQFKLRFDDQDRRRLWHMVRLDCAFDEKEPVRLGDVVHCVMLGVEPSEWNYGSIHWSCERSKVVRECTDAWAWRITRLFCLPEHRLSL